MALSYWTPEYRAEHQKWLRQQSTKKSKSAKKPVVKHDPNPAVCSDAAPAGAACRVTYIKYGNGTNVIVKVEKTKKAATKKKVAKKKAGKKGKKKGTKKSSKK
jgi:hypothetical protein